MAYGKNGSMCWLAGAVCTLQKPVEMLEAKHSFKNVEYSIHANTSDFEIQNTSPKVRVPRLESASDLEHRVEISLDDDLQDMESPIYGDGFEQVLSDDDGLATSMDPRVYSQDSAGELDSEDLTACNRVETVPFRHVSCGV